jgi:hypothetical protein
MPSGVVVDFAVDVDVDVDVGARVQASPGCTRT